MSKKIDISNYEVHALDYLDGTLSSELAAEFEAFLLLHPEIADELEEMRDMDGLKADEALVFDKDALKLKVHATNEIDASNYESFLIAEVEGNLTSKEAGELNAFMAQNPPLRSDRALYQMTKLKAERSVVFPEHGSLYKAIPLWESAKVYAYRAAAVLVIALGSVSIWNILDQEVYMPRDNAIDFVTLDQFPAVESAEQQSRSEGAEGGSSPEAIASNDVGPTSVRRVTAPSKIETLSPDIETSATSALDDRDLMAYEPTVSEWVGDPVAAQDGGGGQALNLAQFVGKKFFGLEPKRSETTKDLFRSGLIKTIDDQESFAFKTSDPEDSKRSVEFLAGNFEFRRVSHK